MVWKTSGLLNWPRTRQFFLSLTLSNVNPLIATLKPQSNGQSYSNTVIGTLAVDGWAVTFGTLSWGLGEAVTRASFRRRFTDQMTQPSVTALKDTVVKTQTVPTVLSVVLKLTFRLLDYEHLYSPGMVEEIKEEKNGTSNKQTVIWPNYYTFYWDCNALLVWLRASDDDNDAILSFSFKFNCSEI